MKIAIPIDNTDGLNAQVSEQFSKAPYFAIVTVKETEAKVELFENPTIKEGAPGLVPEFLAALNVKKVAARNIENRIRILLNHLGIEIIEATATSIESLIKNL